MAATDMSKAGYEPGCKVRIRDPRFVEGLLSGDEKDRLAGMRESGPFIFDRSEFPFIYMHHPLGAEAREHYSVVERDYDEAQEARHKRFDELVNAYPGDAGVPENTDTIERFCGVQKSGASVGDGSYAFVWGDTFEECAELVASDIFDDWWPEAIFDLDTGERIELHIANPTITRSEDQGCCVNVLEPGAAEEQAKYVEENYELVGYRVKFDCEASDKHVADFMADMFMAWATTPAVSNASHGIEPHPPAQVDRRERAMKSYEVHTEETIHGVYVIQADSPEEARAIFENGDAPSPQLFESLDHDITEVKEA